MKNKPPENINELLLQLYALSHEQSLENFQNTALALLKQVLAFDASIWGTATTGANGIDIHSFHLHNKTPDMVASYEEVKHLDSASAGMFHKPKMTQAFCTNSFFAGRDTHPIRDFMTKFEQPHFLLSTDLKTNTNSSSLLHWLTLYRAKQSAHYSTADVERLHAFAPHLKQALTLNRSSHLNKVAGSWGGRSNRAIGIADSKGHIYAHNAQFMALVSKATGEDYANRIVLPPSLTALLAQAKRAYIWHNLILDSHLEHGLFILRLREQTMADTLTAREREVAALIAKGRTYKQAAAELGKATGTVRNQIQVIYSKLQVNNIAEMVKAISDGDQ